MRSIGKKGYIERTRAILEAAFQIKSAVKTDPAIKNDIEIVGNPVLHVIGFTSKVHNM